MNKAIFSIHIFNLLMLSTILIVMQCAIIVPFYMFKEYGPAIIIIGICSSIYLVGDYSIYIIKDTGVN